MAVIGVMLVTGCVAIIRVPVPTPVIQEEPVCSEMFIVGGHVMIVDHYKDRDEIR